LAQACNTAPGCCTYVHLSSGKSLHLYDKGLMAAADRHQKATSAATLQARRAAAIKR